jgi:hypothetical protein
VISDYTTMIAFSTSVRICFKEIGEQNFSKNDFWDLSIVIFALYFLNKMT